MKSGISSSLYSDPFQHEWFKLYGRRRSYTVPNIMRHTLVHRRRMTLCSVWSISTYGKNDKRLRLLRASSMHASPMRRIYLRQSRGHQSTLTVPLRLISGRYNTDHASCASVLFGASFPSEPAPTSHNINSSACERIKFPVRTQLRRHRRRENDTRFDQHAQISLACRHDKPRKRSWSGCKLNGGDLW